MYDTWELDAPGIEHGDRFGSSVAIEGNTALVGAPNANAARSGAAYIFTYDGSSWGGSGIELNATDPGTTDRFGTTVALNGDCAFVGVPYDNHQGSSAGSIYIFSRNMAGDWDTSGVRLIPSEVDSSDRFGYSIASKGDYTLVGAPGGSEATYVLKRDDSVSDPCKWDIHQKLLSKDHETNDDFGLSVSLSDDASIALVGAPYNDDDGSNSGSAYVFRLQDDGFFDEGFKLTAYDAARNDRFGGAVSLAGRYGVIGAADAEIGSADGNSGSAFFFPLDNVPTP